jgi:hypothetical protein
MTSLLDRLFRLRLVSSLHTDDSAIRERRIAELRSLLDEIAAPTGDEASNEADRGEGEWRQTSCASC